MEKSSFFNSINGDRKYKASDFAEFFNSLITNGVFPNPSTNLQVIANNDMTITIKAGKAWINGYIYYNDTDLILNVGVADGVLNRIDRIVLRMDTLGRAINAVVKKGAFASSPVAPVLQRDADGYEIGIADIYIAAGATQITQANITDLRLNNTYCGVVNSLIQADTTAIFNQYLDWFNSKTNQYQSDMITKEADFTNQFNTWFDTVKNTLSGDTAGNLLNLINENTSSITNLGNTVASQVVKIADIILSSDVAQIDFTSLGLEIYRFIKVIAEVKILDPVYMVFYVLSKSTQYNFIKASYIMNTSNSAQASGGQGSLGFDASINGINFIEMIFNNSDFPFKTMKYFGGLTGYYNSTIQIIENLTGTAAYNIPNKIDGFSFKTSNTSKTIKTGSRFIIMGVK